MDYVLRKITVFVVICSIVVCVSACAKTDEGENISDNGKAKQEEQTEETAENSKENTKYSDPLKGYEIDFPSGWESGENFKMMTDFLEAESVKPDEILMVNSNDFDGDNEPEIFVFTGEMTDKELEIYEGSLWLITKEGYENVWLGENNGWTNLCGSLNFKDRAYMYMDEYYGTGALSYVFTVENNSAVRTLFSELGVIGDVKGNDFEIYVEAYDNMSSEYEDGSRDYYGHTWKPYYFYYDEAKKDVYEYAAAKVYDDAVSFMLGDHFYEDYFYEKSAQYNLYETDCMYRANGILTINYERYLSEDGELEYGNINYDHRNGEYVDVYVYNLNSEDPVFESNFGGKYRRFICPELAVFPTEEDAYFIEEDDGDKLVTMGLVVDYLENMNLYEKDLDVVDFDEEDYYMHTTKVAFVAYKSFKDFKAYSMEPYVSGDTMVNAKDEIYSHGELSPGKPLVIYFAFPGDFSANGFSFIDESGKERTYMITISGYDGSLEISEVS